MRPREDRRGLRHRHLEEPGRGGVQPRQAVDEEHQGSAGHPLHEGHTVVHDKERARNGVIAKWDFESKAYKVDVANPAYLDATDTLKQT